MDQEALPEGLKKATRELAEGQVVEERPEEGGLAPVFRWEA